MAGDGAARWAGVRLCPALSGHGKEGGEKSIVRRAKKHWSGLNITINRTVNSTDLIYNLRTLLVLLSEE